MTSKRESRSLGKKKELKQTSILILRTGAYFDDDGHSSTFDTPNCPVCLVPVEVTGPDESPYFLCPVCGTAFLDDFTVE